MNRREFLRRSIAASGFAVTGVASVFLLIERFSETPKPQNLLSALTFSDSRLQSVPAGYVFLAPLSALNGKTSAYFNHPKFGSALLLNFQGAWKAFSATCTHAVCTVEYTNTSISCPCHQGYFNPANGAVQGGPPPRSLPQFGVMTLGTDLYVTEGTI
jgi:Rieske Fe-S protein